MKVRALLLALLVLLAGCGGSVQETQTTTPQTTQAPTATQAETATATTQPTETTEETTETPTTTPRPENPWNKENVTVYVQYDVNTSRDITPLVNETLRYWNNHTDDYGAYSEIQFVSTPNQEFADIVVEVVPQIESCGIGGTDDTVGCASLLGQYDSPSYPEYVQIVAGYSNKSTTETLKHEFGHIMGVEHGEEPMPLMEARAKQTYLSQPDIQDRALPWRNSTLSVYVDIENVTSHDRDDINEQVGHALSYYENGAEGSVPKNVTFTRTNNRSAADIRVMFPDGPIECGSSTMRKGSCMSYRAYNTDVDDAFEYYSRLTISIRGLEEDAVGWHVGSWLVDSFGLTGDEVPGPFVDADYDDRRSSWWK